MRQLHHRILLAGAPGRNRGLQLREVDGKLFTVVCEGDAFAMFHGRGDMTAFPVSTPNMARLLWWLLWEWWVLGTWCGLRSWAWGWALRRAIRQAAR